MLKRLAAQSPVVEEEIGDTWIHGAASEPAEIQQYREMLRLRDKWTAERRFEPGSKEYSDFCDKLMLIPEHTWGLDEKKFLSDFKHYSIGDFREARQADKVSKDAIPDKYRYMGSFAKNDHDRLSSELFVLTDRRSFRFFESSWQEQRAYIH